MTLPKALDGGVHAMRTAVTGDLNGVGLSAWR